MMVKLLKPIVKEMKVLDLGCGSCLFSRKLRKWGGRVTGVDFSEKMLEIARREVPNAEFVKADIRNLPFPARSFDIVASSLVLHYIKNPTPVFREAARILKSNGVFVFSLHHPFSPVSVDGKFVAEGDGQYMTAGKYFQNDRYTWRMLDGMELASYHHTFEMLVMALSKAGLVVESLLEARPAPSSRKLNPMSFDEASQVPTFCAFRVIKLKR